MQQILTRYFPPFTGLVAMVQQAVDPLARQLSDVTARHPRYRRADVIATSAIDVGPDHLLRMPNVLVDRRADAAIRYDEASPLRRGSSSIAMNKRSPRMRIAIGR